MGSLERVLTQINPPYPSQAQPSPYQVAQPQVTQQSNLASQVQPWAYQAQQVAQTLPTSVSPTQVSSQTSTAPQSGPHGLSPATHAVVNHFGIEAPGILNQYSCALEDMLMDQAGRMDNLALRHDAMETILTNPDHLANYTDRFFTEVYPVDIDSPGQGQQAPQAYQPRYDMPAPPANAGGSTQAPAPQQQWETFGDVMNRSPENAWRYLSQIGPEALRSKLLFMDAS
jgi:hypothetical protein